MNKKDQMIDNQIEEAIAKRHENDLTPTQEDMLYEGDER